MKIGILILFFRTSLREFSKAFVFILGPYVEF